MLKTHKYFYWGLTLVVALFLCSCASSHRDTSNSNKVIKIAYLPIVQALPLHLAIQKGYFKKAGLNVEAIRFEAPNQIIDALIAGNVDFAIAAATGITSISEYKNPGVLKIFSLIGSHFPDHIDQVLIVKKGSPITEISQLKGKKLGTVPGIQWRTISTHVLQQAGLTADKDVELVQLAMSLQLQALASGQVDALLTIEPTGIIGKSQKIAQDLIVSPVTRYVANPLYNGCGVVTTQFEKANPSTTFSVLTIFKNAFEEIVKDPANVRTYLKTYTPLTDEVTKKIPLSVWKMYSDLQPSDLDAAQKFVDIFTTHGVINGKMDVRKEIYTSP